MVTKKNKKDKWFIAVRGSYLPNNSKGWLTYIPYFAYLVVATIYVWSLDINKTGRVYLVVVQWGFAGLLMTVVARNKS